MVQLQILSGKMAGTRWIARHFPLRIGRAPQNDLRLEEDGVWDDHLQVVFGPVDGFTLVACPNALVAVNHESIQSFRLRNGDLIEFGSMRLRFWLAEPNQQGLRLREAFAWALIALVSLGQIALVYLLIK